MVQLSMQQPINALRDDPRLNVVGYRRRYKHWTVRLGSWLILASLGGCHGSSPTLHIAVPAGFRGAFIIQTSDPSGEDIKQTNGTYMCNIPRSGVVKVRGDGPFYTWHTLKVSFDNGDIIPISKENENLADDVVAYWSGGSAPRGLMYGFIGTRPEALAWYKETETGGVIPGKVREQTKTKKDEVKRTDR